MLNSNTNSVTTVGEWWCNTDGGYSFGKKALGGGELTLSLSLSSATKTPTTIAISTELDSVEIAIVVGVLNHHVITVLVDKT